MSNIGRRSGFGTLLVGACLLLLALVAPQAEAKSAKLDAQLVGNAVAKGSKVTAPVLLSSSTAKKLKVDSALATLTMKRSAQLNAPAPSGTGTYQIGAETLRSGDNLTGKAKLKGSRAAIIPTLAGSKLSVKSRESAYSVDELTNLVVTLFGQLNSLTIRVDALEDDFQLQLDALRAELEALKAQNASLTGQINSILAQLGTLQTTVNGLQTTIAGITGQLGTLTTQLNGLQTQITTLAGQLTGLQTDLDALEALVGGVNVANLQTTVNGLVTQVGTLQTTVNGLVTDVGILCGIPIVNPC